MTKYVEAIFDNNVITRGKIYEVIDEDKISYLINGCEYHYPKDLFKEVEEPKEETNTFKFIPETEITYATVNGVKGILIKE